MLRKLFKTGKLYGYNTDTEDNVFGARGIVLANSKEDARNKLISVYLKHGYSETQLDNLSVWKVEDNCFDNVPDVLEI